MYGKMKMELKYLRNFRLVLVTKNAKTPPNTIETTQEMVDSSSVLSSGVHRFVFAVREVNRST